MRYYLNLLQVIAMIGNAVCFTDTFIKSKGLKFAENEEVKKINSVSELQCAYTCFADKGCSALKYGNVLKACSIYTSCYCPLNESNPSWDIWTRKDFVGPRDCSDHKGTSGVYCIYPVGEECGFGVFCDMETDGGGWTVFQRRFDGTVDFYLGWSEYEVGFGDLSKEFWMGNAKLHKLTSSGQYTLRVDLVKFPSEARYAKYETFSIGGAEDKYRLHVSGYSGDAGDGLTYHDGMKFSTKDQVNDFYGKNCAYDYQGAWWFNHCYSSHLNGEYLNTTHNYYGRGLHWKTMTSNYESLKSSKMMIRRKGEA